MSKREIAAADIETLYELFARKACDIVNEGHEVMPQLAIVKMDDEKPGEVAYVAMVDPKLVNAMQHSDGTKNLMMGFVKALLRPHPESKPPISFTPDAIVHVSEAWVRSSSYRPGQKMPDDPLDGYGSVSEHPQRTEAVLVAVHTADRSFQGCCPIKGTGRERTATFASIFRGGELSGRFAMQDDGNPAHGTH